MIKSSWNSKIILKLFFFILKQKFTDVRRLKQFVRSNKKKLSNVRKFLQIDFLSLKDKWLRYINSFGLAFTLLLGKGFVEFLLMSYLTLMMIIIIGMLTSMELSYVSSFNQHNLWGRNHYHNSANEKTKAEKNDEICPRSYSYEGPEPRSKNHI